ncbi:T9SS type A sorting domain-containing protein [Flavobacterium sp. Arc3]|uniref:T9SS type A sorting domain-containing protein n=1 Tax=Flavobacterium sp. Arc3 TaxID=3046686 RepID=UPI00352CAFB2
MVGMIQSSYYRRPSHGKKGNKPSVFTYNKSKGMVIQEVVIKSVKEILSHEFIDCGYRLMTSYLHRDGYKIKTLPTLVVGDTFQNEANIYFDYNFPILTNKATSTFKTLATSDFEFSNYFSVFPNPVNEILNINYKNSIEVQSIAIYDILGQMVIAVPNATSVTKVDVSKLASGKYFLKMNTDKGSSNMKFIKN